MLEILSTLGFHWEYSLDDLIGIIIAGGIIGPFIYNRAKGWANTNPLPIIGILGEDGEWYPTHPENVSYTEISEGNVRN